MFKNFLKVALRNITRNKAFSVINIAGLAVGLATCLLIMLYILDERSYDQHQQNGDNIYRVASTNNKGETWVATGAPLAAGVKSELPEVEQVARLMTFPDIAKMLMKYEEGSQKKQFFESNGYYVDATFFQVLTYDFIYGNPATALTAPNSLVISGEISRKFFGAANPVGKQLKINTPFGEFIYTITAVFDNAKYKSHVPANYFLSMRNNDMWNWVQQQTSWVGNNVFFTYVKLKNGSAPEQFEKKLQTLFNEKAGADLKSAGFSQQLFIQPLKDIYLHSSSKNEISANGNISYLYILASIAAFILIIACVNFMNLSTARSERRAKEVGIRKVIGAAKGTLIRQFIGESFIMCLMALVIALILVLLLLPYFNLFTQKNITLFSNPGLLLWIILLTIITGVIAGAYPAFYLSAFKPISVLKGRVLNNFSAKTIRKGLVVFQFTISICLIIAAVVIGQQLDYLRNQPMGFNKSQKIILPLGQSYLNDGRYFNPLKEELLKLPEINAVSSGSAYPGIPNYSDMLFFAEGKSRNEIVDIHLAAIEKDYIQTLGFELLEGRTFSGNPTADSAGIVLNETAIKALGYTVGNAVGRSIQYDYAGNHATMQIIGVVKDFNFESLHSPIQPYGFTTSVFANRYGFAIANTTTTDYAVLLRKIKTTWTRLYPSIPFEYSFLDQDFQRNYEKEQIASGIVRYFTIIAILIACLGLFGLAAFSAEQRKKEIGIRKVLGATISDVTVLLSGDFIQPVLVAFIIASPLAWYVMEKWLNGFSYRIQMSWWAFIISGMSAFLIALVTVSSQAVRTALADPVKSLKAE